jgi:recombination protein RecT
MSEAKPKTVVATVTALLESRRASLEALAQKHLNVDRLFKVALNAISSQPALQKCTPNSLFRAIVSAAELGLEVGGALEHAYLVPYKDKAELVIGYRGYLRLMRLSGEVRDCVAHVVYKNDVFKFRHTENGAELDHRPALENRGVPIGAYAIVRLRNGVNQVEWMPWEEIQAVKAKALARAYKPELSPWTTDEHEMARKTPIRRAAKYTPLSPAVASAVAADSDEGEVVDGQVVPLSTPARLPTLESMADLEESA